MAMPRRNVEVVDFLVNHPDMRINQGESRLVPSIARVLAAGYAQPF